MLWIGLRLGLDLDLGLGKVMQRVVFKFTVVFG